MFWLKWWYSTHYYKGTSYLNWAKRWFLYDNDTFYMMFGFNFNPHDYKGLYEIAKKEVYGEWS